MNNKIILSAAIATYNEEENIVDCIQSLKQVADEIVIADGNSTDRTTELAEKLGAKIISTTNKPMFHINKNLAVNNCVGKWIIVIDADERISKELVKDIKAVIDSNNKFNGYWINRKNWFLGGFLKKGGAYPDRVIRLFKKGKGIHPEISVHEQIEIDGDVGHINSNIIHLADPNFSRYLKRANRYTDRTADDFEVQKISKGVFSIVSYMLVRPLITFTLLFFRHKGYEDGFRGFVWALFSGAHYFYAYSKYLSQGDLDK